ncbi:peptidase M23 [Aestuariirhabdus litorea]|uniref:Peptidase M23 n=2 Tax=Aestuariirhabdus litorea TaxID=2528527 RepID=A0A3P3VNQ1_9GAMM|nr:peptidase M23 [Aestuariirhabdus litorea]RWW93712.1 peptidase M23 [Endozoicomonadaceae bacterium GTF-13]
MLASGLASLVGAALLLLPSGQVQAEREEIPLTLELAGGDTPSPSLAKLQDTNALPVEQPAVIRTSVAPQESLRWDSVKIRPGSTLSTIFRQQGLSPSLLHTLVTSSEQGKLLNRVSPGQKIEFLQSQDGAINKIRYVRNRLESVVFTRSGEGFSAEEITLTPNARQTFAEAEINHSLFVAAQNAGMSENVTMKLANIFGWDIDFALDIRKGDSFRVIYEENFLEGEKISDGEIVAAQFINQGQVYTAVRYTDSKGRTDYYSPDGRSMRKAFLRSPVDFARISSRFNLSRKHPVLNKIRAHKGVDYAATTGTPIRAAGDGKVIHATLKGGYGKTVIIQHGQRYSTLYAHLSKYGRGIRSGKQVKQGQIIGYVGATGLATGPHLHYEFRENGVHVNPMTVKLPSAQPIPKQELAAFQSETQLLLSQLEQPTAILALND